MNKSKLCKAIALATALGGVGVGLYAPTATAVNLSQTGLGDVLIFPYYTARDGWQTTLTFINTSDNFLAVKFRFMEGVNSRDVLDFNVVMSPYDVYTGVVEAGNGTYGDKTSGIRFRIPALETTCTAPYLAPDNSFGLNSTAYTGVNADGGPTDNDRLFEGYVIAMVMGHANKADLTNLSQMTVPSPPTYPNQAGVKAAATTLLLAEHANAGNTSAAVRATQCTAVGNLFLATNFLNTAALFGEPINVLKGNYSLLNVPRGTSAGGNAVTLANFFNIGVGDFVRPAAVGFPLGASPPAGADVGLYDQQCDVAYSRQFNYAAYPGSPVPVPVQWSPLVANPNTGCPNMLTPQVSPYFLEPSLTSAYNGPIGGGTTGRAVVFNDTGSLPPIAPVLVNYDSYALSGFQAVSEVMRARTASNEWSVNPNLGVATNWVLTHPTKSFFVDDPTHSSTTTVAVPNVGSTARSDVVQAAINKARFKTQNVAGVGWLPDRPAENFAGPAFITAGQTALNPFPASFSATTAAAGKSCVLVGINIWDRDELTAVTGITPSPIEPTAQRQLCYETNVVNFNPNGQTVFGSKLTVDVSEDVNALWAQATAAHPAQPFGWMQFNFAVDPATLAQAVAMPAGFNRNGVLPNPANTSLAGSGLPVIGFMMRERIISTTNVTGNYGDLANHSYTRTFSPQP